MESHSGTSEDESPTVWVYSGHAETPAPVGDAIELIDDMRFLLHGCKVDLINVAGKQPSLVYLNHRLNAIAGAVNGIFYTPDGASTTRHTRDSAAVTRLVASVVALGLSAADVLRTLHDRTDAVFMPHPLLLVDALPCNETGKLAYDVLVALIAQHSHHNMRKHGVCFTTPAGRPALPGHFPGRSIVSGAALLDHVFHAIGAVLDRSLDAYKISSVKLFSPAVSGEVFDLAFETTPSNAVRSITRTGRREVASGVLFAPAPEDIAA